MKRYVLMYESDQIICGSNEHTWGYADTLKTVKGYISRCRKEDERYNPRNFRIYDTWGELDPETNYVPCIYSVD